MIKSLVIDWLVNQVIAWITRWLDQNHPTQRLRDAGPAPIVRPPVATQASHPGLVRRRGRWVRER
jgi:hypothetical protein